MFTGILWPGFKRLTFKFYSKTFSLKNSYYVRLIFPHNNHITIRIQKNKNNCRCLGPWCLQMPIMNTTSQERLLQVRGCLHEISFQVKSNTIILVTGKFLTDACPELSFSEGSCHAGTNQLIWGANHLTGSCMMQIFAEGCFRTDFSCLIFCQYFFIIGLVLMSQDYRRVPMFLFYLSMPMCFVVHKSRYF